MIVERRMKKATVDKARVMLREIVAVAPNSETKRLAELVKPKDGKSESGRHGVRVICYETASDGMWRGRERWMSIEVYLREQAVGGLNSP